MREPKDIIIRGRTLEDILEESKECKFRNILDLRGVDLSFTNLSNAYLRKTQLESADLSSANLSGADLSSANLKNTCLHKAQLKYTDLCSANLSLASLYSANLFHANLSYADITSSVLSCANLGYASLRCANLYNSIIKGANLQNADLSFANLSRATLNYAKIEGANLIGANLYQTKGEEIGLRRGQVLTEDLIGYKLCLDGNDGTVIVTLKIPKGAIVFSINGRKCRTNKAKVIAIDGKNRAYSHYNHMSYYVGDEITVNNFDYQYNIECSTGIHFFKSRKEAEEYAFY